MILDDPMCTLYGANWDLARVYKGDGSPWICHVHYKMPEIDTTSSRLIPEEGQVILFAYCKVPCEVPLVIHGPVVRLPRLEPGIVCFAATARCVCGRSTANLTQEYRNG